jgi:hypothetical protein
VGGALMPAPLRTTIVEFGEVPAIIVTIFSTQRPPV